MIGVITLCIPTQSVGTRGLASAYVVSGIKNSNISMSVSGFTAGSAPTWREWFCRSGPGRDFSFPRSAWECIGLQTTSNINQPSFSKVISSIPIITNQKHDRHNHVMHSHAERGNEGKPAGCRGCLIQVQQGVLKIQTLGIPVSGFAAGSAPTWRGWFCRRAPGRDTLQIIRISGCHKKLIL